MTIQGLWNHYKTKVGYKPVPLSHFKGKRIAVDAFGIMYETRSVAKSIYLKRINPFIEKVDEQKVNALWVGMFLDSIIAYMTSGVTPVMVFDGIENDPLKVETLKERTQYSQGYEKKIQVLKDAYKTMEPDSIPVQAVNELRNLLSKINLMPYNSVVLAKDMCKNLGIPYVYCKGEGERTCSLMSDQSVCAAVISSDSDTLCCGARIVLKEKCKVSVGPSEELGFMMASLDSLLDNLGMSFTMFQDLCIMSGTDFNKNMKQISWTRSHKLLMQHGSIEAVGAVKDISCLNVAEVRKRFAVCPWEETTEEHSLEFKVPMDGMFVVYEVSDHIKKFNRARDRCISCSERL